MNMVKYLRKCFNAMEKRLVLSRSSITDACCFTKMNCYKVLKKAKINVIK